MIAIIAKIVWVVWVVGVCGLCYLWFRLKREYPNLYGDVFPDSFMDWSVRYTKKLATFVMFPRRWQALRGDTSLRVSLWLTCIAMWIVTVVGIAIVLFAFGVLLAILVSDLRS